MSYTAKNTVISPEFLVWNYCGKAQFLHSFGQFARNYAETVPFRKIFTSGNQVKLRYFSQCFFNMSHENHHLKDFTDFNDFENLKKEPTCFKSTSSTTIDLFLINRKGCFMKSLTNKTGKSDHRKVIYTFLCSHFTRTNFNEENYFFKKIFLKISKTLIICLKVFMTLSQTL